MATYVRRISTKFVPKSLDENLSDYPQETTIHGVKYLANRTRPLADRIFWITIFIVSMSCLGYFVYKICKAWLEHPVMITDRNKPTQVFEIPFPAVTICPVIKVQQDKFNIHNFTNETLPTFVNETDYLKSEFLKKYVLTTQICRKLFQKHAHFIFKDLEFFDKTVSDNLDSDWYNLLNELSPTRDDIMEMCQLASWDMNQPWLERTKKNCQKLFSTILTNDGVCFTFNSIQDLLRVESLHQEFVYYDTKNARDGWDPENGYTKAEVYPYRGIVKGAPVGAAGLKFVLAANMSDATPFCHSKSLGYKMVLHSPAVYPHTYENYISLEYGKEYKIAVKPKTIKTADDLRSFEPDVRNCYFNDERQLKFYTFYNEVNCQLECYTNFSAKMFKGAPFASPRDANTSNCILPHKNFGWDLPQYVHLFYEHFKMYGTPENVVDITSFVDCNCLPECNSINYEHVILKESDDFSFELELVDGDTHGDIMKTTIEIIFDASTFIGQKRVRMYTFETMISDFGGLLGLFMGGSVLSLFELFYFLTIRNCFKPKNLVSN